MLIVGGGQGGIALGARLRQLGVPTIQADLIFASLPDRIMHEFQIPLYEQMRERDADFSLVLALQLKARHEDIPTEVYALAEVHHPR